MEKFNVLKPSYYDEFQCKGGGCQYTCCQGWNISMTREEYRKWKKKGYISNEMWNEYMTFVPDEQKTERNYAMFQLTKEQFCPLLDEEGLCQIQREHGPEALTHTCQVFPRQYHRYFEQVELSLSLGCERVLELLLEAKDGILLEQGTAVFSTDFSFGSWYGQQQRRKQPQLKSYYDIQTLSLALLQAEDISLEGRILLLAMAIYQIDKLYQQGQGDRTAAYIEQYLEKLENSDAQRMFQDIPAGNPLASFNSVLTTMLRLNPEGNPALRKIREKILSRIKPPEELIKGDKGVLDQWKAERYQACMNQLSDFLKGKEHFMENMTVAYFLYSNIPYKDIEKGIWENYLYLIWVYMMIKISLSAYLDPDSTDGDMIHCCAVLFRSLGHNSTLFQQILKDFKADGDTPAHIAILMKNISPIQ